MGPPPLPGRASIYFTSNPYGHYQQFSSFTYYSTLKEGSFINSSDQSHKTSSFYCSRVPFHAASTIIVALHILILNFHLQGYIYIHEQEHRIILKLLLLIKIILMFE